MSCGNLTLGVAFENPGVLLSFLFAVVFQPQVVKIGFQGNNGFGREGFLPWLQRTKLWMGVGEIFGDDEISRSKSSSDGFSFSVSGTCFGNIGKQVLFPYVSVPVSCYIPPPHFLPFFGTKKKTRQKKNEFS